MPNSELLVFFHRAPAGLRRRALEQFARLLRERVAAGRRFQCLIADDRELRRLNRKFLGKDYPTDVLSFPAVKNGSRARGATSGSLGDIAISGDRAIAQAHEFGHSVKNEVGILMLHGLLHLMGMDHERDRGAMARVEASWRGKLALSGSLIERATL